MRIVLLSQYYPPELGAPQARLSFLARALVREGHDVTVLTGMPNYPSGELFPGYGGLLRRQQLEGVRVIRTYIYPTNKTDYLRRLASYASFSISSAMVGTGLLGSVELLIVESPPLFLGLSGVWLSRLKNARLVFNVSDLWPESVVRLGLLERGSRRHRMAQWLEGYCYRKAWLVTGQSSEIVADVAARFPGIRTLHVSNGADTNVFRPELAASTVRSILGDGDCIALYAGLHGLAQGLEGVLSAVARLGPDGPAHVVFMGDGPEKLRLVQQARELNARRVRFLDARPHGEMPAVLASADIVLVPLARYMPGAVPSKLYEAMAAGRPVILIAEGESAGIVLTHQAGVVVRPGDVRGLAEALTVLAREPTRRRWMGANGRRAAVKYYDRSRITETFVKFLEAM